MSYLEKSCKMKCFSNSRRQQPEGFKHGKKCPLCGLSKPCPLSTWLCKHRGNPLSKMHESNHILGFLLMFFWSICSGSFSLKICTGPSSHVAAGARSWSLLSGDYQTVKCRDTSLTVGPWLLTQPPFSSLQWDNLTDISSTVETEWLKKGAF